MSHGSDARGISIYGLFFAFSNIKTRNSVAQMEHSVNNYMKICK